MKLFLTYVITAIFIISTNAQTDSILYSFFVAGHTYGAPGINNKGFHPPFKRKFDFIKSNDKIRFGILTGDIVSPDPVVTDWEEIDSDIDSLGLPVYFAVGNHDMENWPSFKNRYGPIFKDHYGVSYYYFVFKNDLFIILDPNINNWNISGSQLQFLIDVVFEQSTISDNIFVFFHEILWREPGKKFNHILWNSDSGRSDSVNFWTEVIPIFRQLPNNVIMFAGDLGASYSTNVSYDRYYNISFIASGMGDYNGDNFIIINVNLNKSIDFDLISLSDTAIYSLGQLADYIVVNKTDKAFPISNLLNDPFLCQNLVNSKISYFQGGKLRTKIQLFNKLGVLVFEVEFKGKLKYPISLSNIPDGLYYARIFNNLTMSKFMLAK